MILYWVTEETLTDFSCFSVFRLSLQTFITISLILSWEAISNSCGMVVGECTIDYWFLRHEEEEVWGVFSRFTGMKQERFSSMNLLPGKSGKFHLQSQGHQHKSQPCYFDSNQDNAVQLAVFVLLCCRWNKDGPMEKRCKWVPGQMENLSGVMRMWSTFTESEFLLTGFTVKTTFIQKSVFMLFLASS